jgi:hypothetical protein
VHLCCRVAGGSMTARRGHGSDFVTGQDFWVNDERLFN